jgi:hypothetical protein
MTESDRIASAERELRRVLETAAGPISARELGEKLPAEASRSLVRLALQRMIARGDIEYDPQRRYSLRTPVAHGA